MFGQSEKAVSARDKALAEHSVEIDRLQKTLDDVEQANRDLHIKLNAANERNKALTSAVKWVVTAL